ncbi:hypothetical protein J7F03_23465 [Streptomyces sp. ISL-43]|uniref:hypothetical protein n=1 Tax=Streptomyces sp. ISL-43 TaxID=2819183 RepID=UPI001BEBEF3B|nr:hypothetical protein [Streptomyces sp. ISL-43]MBT2449979.1 hypothetical protein [Streptomyces sp. ISL-43]
MHEHQIDLEELPNLSVCVLLELARRLDIHPADLMDGADDLFERPANGKFSTGARPAPNTTPSS